MQLEAGVVYIRVTTLIEFSQVALYSKVHLIVKLVNENSVDLNCKCGVHWLA